jgi:hypothetical protein
MNLKADAPFFEAAFNARPADKLLAEGYGISRLNAKIVIQVRSGLR